MTIKTINWREKKTSDLPQRQLATGHFIVVVVAVQAAGEVDAELWRCPSGLRGAVGPETPSVCRTRWPPKTQKPSLGGTCHGAHAVAASVRHQAWDFVSSGKDRGLGSRSTEEFRDPVGVIRHGDALGRNRRHLCHLRRFWCPPQGMGSGPLQHRRGHCPPTRDSCTPRKIRGAQAIKHRREQCTWTSTAVQIWLPYS